MKRGLSAEVAEHLPQLPNRRVQPVIEVDEGVGWPQALTHGLACDHFARPFEEQYQ